MPLSTHTLTWQMADGIDDSACVVAFITERYLSKAGGKGPNGANDNCEFFPLQS